MNISISLQLKRLAIIWFIIQCCVSGPLQASDSLHGASDIVLLQSACPIDWSKVDQILAKPAAVPWADEADRLQQVEYQRQFIIAHTGRVSRDAETASRDVITVLSECVKRHNAVVNTEFNKNTGTAPVFAEALSIETLMQMIISLEMDD